MQNNPLVNIVITTTKEREYFYNKCLHSLKENTIIPYRIIVVNDSSRMVAHEDSDIQIHYLCHGNQGIACALNAGWVLAEMYNRFYKKAKYFCYLQDDTVITEKGWLDKLIKIYERFINMEPPTGKEIVKKMKKYKIGFFSGHDAPEHKTIDKGSDFSYPGGIIKIKESMRATNIIGETELWQNVMPIPRLDADGKPRGFPDPRKDGKRGKGSNIDIWLTGWNSKDFLPKQAAHGCPAIYGHKCLIIPGLVKHVGWKAENSTWGNPNKEYDS